MRKILKTILRGKLAGVNISVEKLQSKSRNSSFCVSIQADKVEQLYEPTFWPKSIILRRYRFFGAVLDGSLASWRRCTYCEYT